MTQAGFATPEHAAVFGELMTEVTAANARFGHRAHVHLTWLAVRRVGMPAAIGMVCDGIQQTTRYAGLPRKYHATVSRAWVQLVAHHVDDTGIDGSGTDGSGIDGSGIDGSGIDGSGLDGSADDGTAQDFATFAGRNPALLDKRLLTHFYRSATLASPPARTGWVEPDLNPFPWQRNDRGRTENGDSAS